MKSLKFLSIFIAVMLWQFNATAQFSAYFDPLNAYNKLLLDKGGTNQEDITREGAYKVTGSPFLSGSGMYGNLLLKTGEVKNNLELFYNIYKGKLFFMQGGKKLELVNEIFGFSLTTDSVVKSGGNYFVSAELFGEKASKGFYQVLDSVGGYHILKYYSITLAQNTESYADNTYRVYQHNVDLYVAKPGEKPQKVGNNNKFLKAVFGDKFEAAKTFVNEQKLNMQSGEDVVRLFKNILK
jgi:hypothetical protein